MRHFLTVLILKINIYGIIQQSKPNTALVTYNKEKNETMKQPVI